MAEALDVPGPHTSFDFSRFAAEVDNVDAAVVTISNPGPKKVGPQDFEVLKLIGIGGFGKVFQVRKLTGKDVRKIYAMKVVEKSRIQHEKDVEHVCAEENVLRDTHHPFIVDMFYSFHTRGRLYLILEYLIGGELTMKLTLLSEDNAKFYLAEIVLALEHLHQLGIIYRDLKPENLLFNAQGHIKLTDFGLCKQFMMQGDKATSVCGTVDYMAPELFSDNHEHDKAVDWWSLGIVMYEMLFGMPPFTSSNRKKIIDNICLKGRLEMPRIPSITRHAKDLLKKLLCRNVRKRLGSGVNDAVPIKRHSFFRDINWDVVASRTEEPPYLPRLAGEEDVSHFDVQVTSRVPKFKISSTDGHAEENHNYDFKSFSYIAPFLEENSLT